MKGFSSGQKLGPQMYMTLQPISGGKVAADMIPKAMYTEDVANRVPEGGAVNSIRLTAHGVKAGQIVRFKAGAHEGVELTVAKVTANEIFFSHKLDAAVTAADEFIVLSTLTLTIDKDGNLQTSQGPLQYIKDSAVVQVIKDTVDPNNTNALPVEIVAVDGTEINITAGDINIQTSHSGANPDSIQVGNGTNILDINASNEALTHDQDVLDELVLQKALLTSLEAKDFSTGAKQDSALTELQAILAKIIAAPATEAKQDILEATLEAILAKIIAAPSTEAKQDTAITALGSLLTELELKADLTDTQPVSLASVPLATDAATETTLAAVLAKIIAAPATEAKQDTAITSINAITAKLIAAPATEAKQDILEATLEAILAKIIAAPATEAKQDSIITELTSIKDTAKAMDVFQFLAPVSIAGTNIPAVSSPDGLVVSPLTSTRLRKIQTIEDVGEYLGLYSGGSGSLVLECILPIAGGIVEVDIPAGTRLVIKHLKASVIDTDTYFAANLIG